MLRFGKIVVSLGTLFTFLPVAATAWAWLRIRNTLAMFNAQQELERAFSLYMEDMALAHVFVQVFRLTCIAAGRLILKHRIIGWWIWVLLCGGQVALWLLQLLIQEASWSLFFQGMIWLGLALFTLLAFRDSRFNAWWQPENKS